MTYCDVMEEIARQHQFHADSGCDHGFEDIELPMVVQPKPRYNIHITELIDDDLSNVKSISLDKLRRIPLYVASSPTFYSKVYEAKEDLDKTSNIILESSVQFRDLPVSASVWVVFNHSSLDFAHPRSSYLLSSTSNTDICVQNFRIRIQPGVSIPYMQFYCAANLAKHGDYHYSKGDVMTMFIKHDEYPSDFPHPPLIAILPQSPQTFVALQPKQQLQIITKKGTNIEYTPGVHGCLRHTPGRKIDDCAVAGGPIQLDYFSSVRSAALQECIFINGNELRTVCVPYKDNAGGPVIFNPVSGAVIHVSNINTFTIKMLRENYLPFNCESPCETVENVDDDLAEVEVKVLHPRQQLTLTKGKDSWTIR